MAIFRRSNRLFSSSPSLFSRFQALVFEQQRQRWTHTSAAESGDPQFQGASSVSPLREGACDSSTWRTLDSRIFGVKMSAISQSTWTVLKILQRRGFQAYLVGGCVRDLILGKTPKDFDVVTTATLAQIKDQFHRCIVVGRRFPICQVYIYGSKIEVSSFETIHVDAQQQQPILFSEMPNNCDKKDLVLWKDSMRRDFTINSLFYDPFVNAIYDYVDGIRDAMASEVRTVIPAHLSFKEDCARILRGLRIVARLGLQFSKDTAIAVQDLSWSITTLGKARLMMELNFMLAYGAAVPSICLLQKYKLFDVLLPIQAAYLTDQTKKQPGESSIMLMKLFHHVDKLLSADRPSDCKLWLGLLAFHLALLNHPQNALVVWTFASILYFGSWNRGIKFVRSSVKRHVQFAPEILELSETKSDQVLLEEMESDESLLEGTSHLASLIKSSVNAFVKPEALEESLAKYHMTSQSSELGHQIFVSERGGNNVAILFNAWDGDVKSYFKPRQTMDVDYELLKRGDPDETRFVLGKIILDTLNGESGCHNDEKAGMHRLSDEIIHLQDQNAIATKKRELPVLACPEDSVNRFKDELACQQAHIAIIVKKGMLPLHACPTTAMGISRGEVSYQQNQNITRREGRRPLTTCPLNVVDVKKNEIINQQNQQSIATEMIQILLAASPENAVDTTNEVEVNGKQEQNAVVTEKRLAPLPDCPRGVMDVKDVPVHQKKQNTIAMKKRQRAPPVSPENAVNQSKDKITRQQDQSATAVKKRHVHLSALFE